MVALVENLPTEKPAPQSENRAPDFFAAPPDRASVSGFATRTHAGKNGRFSYDACRSVSLAQGREEALNALDDVLYKMQDYFSENPDGTYLLSTDELHIMMRGDSYLTADRGFDKASFMEFNKLIKGGTGDSHFIGLAGKNFRLESDIHLNGSVLFEAGGVFKGSDINYYFMGFAHAARGVSQFRMEATIVAYNHWQAESGVNVQHNINQQVVGPKWAKYGYEFYGR